MRQHNKKIYYAHSLQVYNTKREKRELRFLKKKFDEVCNPNTEIIWDNATKMKPYFEAVKKSDIVVVSEYMSHIGKGVYEEIKTAFIHKILVLCLRRKFFRFHFQYVKDIKIENENDWQISYGKIIL